MPRGKDLDAQLAFLEGSLRPFMGERLPSDASFGPGDAEVAYAMTRWLRRV